MGCSERGQGRVANMEHTLGPLVELPMHQRRSATRSNLRQPGPDLGAAASDGRFVFSHVSALVMMSNSLNPYASLNP